MKFSIDELKMIHKALLTTIHYKLMNYDLSFKEQEDIRQFYNVENKVSRFLIAHEKGGCD